MERPFIRQVPCHKSSEISAKALVSFLNLSKKAYKEPKGHSRIQGAQNFYCIMKDELHYNDTLCDVPLGISIKVSV
jgi:hypothetical protein